MNSTGSQPKHLVRLSSLPGRASKSEQSQKPGECFTGAFRFDRQPDAGFGSGSFAFRFAHQGGPARQLLAFGCDCFARDDDDFRGIDLRSRAY